MSLTKSCLEIEELVVDIKNPPDISWAYLYDEILKKIENIKNKYIIKLNLIKTTPSNLYFHLIVLNDFKGFINIPFSPNKIHLEDTRRKNLLSLIVPTGIGVEFGGYAGDANVIAHLFSRKCEYLLTHPNVVNGSVLTDHPKNMIYMEGFLLDQFLNGQIKFSYLTKNKIGVLFDKGVTDERLEYEINVLNAAKSFFGCEIIGWAQTENPIKIDPYITEFGFSSGRIKGIEQLIEKSCFLKEKGATAIAICCQIPDSDLNNKYIKGAGIDPIGGIESIISRAVSAATGVVSAHAPVLITQEKVDYKCINPVSASEYIAKSFLPSVLSGLRFAPNIITSKNTIEEKDLFSVSNLQNIIVPASAFGIVGVLNMNSLNNLILVEGNKSSLDVSPKHISMKFKFVKNYLDLLDQRTIENSGICIESLQRPITPVRELPN